MCELIMNDFLDLSPDFESYFTSNYAQSQKDNSGQPPDLNEVSEMEIQQQQNPILLEGKTSIEVLEDDKTGLLLAGCDLDEITHRDISHLEFTGIDASVATIRRISLSLNVCRAAIGFTSKVQPEGRQLPKRTQYIISDSNVLKPGITLSKDFTSPIRGLNRKLGYNASIDASADNFQSFVECDSAIKFFNSDNAGDYIIYDGGLYRRDPLLDIHLQRVQTNSKVAVPIAINKRVTDRSWWLYVQAQRPELRNMYYDTDVAFLLNVLEPGERTPIFKMIRQKEDKFPLDLQRIAAFVRLDSGKITRIETTYQNLYQFETMLSYIYYLSSTSTGELPGVLNNAHTLSKITKGDKQLMGEQFDTFLTGRGIPAIDPTRWSY